MKTEIVLKGEKRSDLNSSFAVFETFKDWKQLRENKVISKGMYFAVVIMKNQSRIEIMPDLFVQGYHPHSSGAALGNIKRRYGQFVRCDKANEYKRYHDDVVFLQANIYQCLGDREVELVLKDGENYDIKETQKFVERICKQRDLQILGELNVLKYSCPKSEGYFLKGRDYLVCAVVVGKSEQFSVHKQVLIFDFHTGIPAVVDYVDEAFSKV